MCGRYLWSPEAGIGSLGLELTCGCELLEMGARNGTWGPLEDQQVVLVIEPSLQFE